METEMEWNEIEGALARQFSFEHFNFVFDPVK